MKTKNPGALEGTEIVYLAKPFGGWSQSPVTINAVPHYSASVEGLQGSLQKQTLNNYAESDGITLFRPEKFGHIAPGHIFGVATDAGSRVTSLPVNGGVDANGLCWIVLSKGRLVQGGNEIPIVIAANYDPAMAGTHNTHTLTAGATSLNPDILVLYDLATTPVQWIIWSWQDNTDGDISIIKNDGTGQVTTWYSALDAVLKTGIPLKMCQGPDGNIYVTIGSSVQQIVVTAGLAAATKGKTLPLGAGWTAQGIVAFKNYVAIIASSTPSSFKRGETKVFLWDGLSTTINGVTSTAANYSFPIPDNFGNGIFFVGTNLFAFTNGRNNSSKIFEFTGKGFKKIFESGLIGLSGGGIQGSLESYQDSLMIGGTKNSLGHLFRFYAGGFHDDGIITDGTNQATSVGMVKNLFTNLLAVGVGYGASTYKIYTQTGFNQYQLNAALRTILYTEGILGRRLYPLGFKGTINRIQIFLSQWGAGASLTLSLYRDYDTTDLLAAKVVDTTTYPSGTNEIDLSDLAITDVSSFYMIITFSHALISNTAAIIRGMIIHWAPSQ